MSLKETELKLQGKPFKWINELLLIVKEYNNTIHSTIKLTPVDRSKPENETKIKILIHSKLETLPIKQYK